MNFNEYQELARSTAIYNKKYSLLYPLVGLAGEAGEISNKLGKLIRDKDLQISEEFRQDMKKELGDVLWFLSNAAADLEISLEDIAKANLEKLFSRKERGVLQGSGDNR